MALPKYCPRNPLRYGVSAVIEGTLPIGGLSSSAAVMHAYVMPGKRYDIGDMKSYEMVQEVYRGIEG